MTRQKKALPPIHISREQAEEAFASYAKADAREQRLKADLDIKITQFREKYTDVFSDLTLEKDHSFEILQTYAVNHRDEFGNRKSLELTHGVIGFRTGTPKLKTRKGFTWASVLNLLKEFLPGYVRIREEPAKDRLLSDRGVAAVAALFPKVGIEVSQEEAFFIELKKELVDF